MVDFRPVLQVVGWVLVVLAASMGAPAVADAVAGFGEWRVFVLSAGLTVFVGLAFVLGMRSRWADLTVRQAYLAIALGWLMPCVFAALPFAFGDAHLPAADAFFEATCGVTATSATMLAPLERLPPGLLLWRGVLQWLGGVGTLAMATAILPALRIGGMQIFRIEMLSPVEKMAPRAARIGSTLIGVYAAITAVLGLLLWLAGMTGFDAWIHAMATISTGGFSTWDSSVGHYRSAAIDAIVTAGMVLGGLPFLLFFRAVRGNVGALFRDAQVRWYLGVMLAGALAVSLWLAVSRHFTAGEALRYGTFTVASVMTGTGFTTIDYGGWTGIPAAVLLFLAFLGGCAGSTTGGIKVFRLQLLLTEALVQMRRLLRPHAILIASFNRRPIADDIPESVMGFLFVFAMAFAALAMGLGLVGLDFISAISGAVGAIANLGVGLGAAVGPGSNLAALPDAAKWLLAAGMIFGRLEIFPLLVLFVPTFWKQ
ncbi:MAG: TrkH family potassium uptake protein [Magnetospirillum sp.]|nr:TrkH family potassium uptake protein [Magnetospirillum sp.]